MTAPPARVPGTAGGGSVEPTGGASGARIHDAGHRGFASDNHAGAHPEIIAAVAAANGGHQHAYGADEYTARLQEVFREHFGEAATAYPVFNGTGGNVIALQAMSEPWSGVICADSAHVHTDECGAPERVGGLKLLAVPGEAGKLNPRSIEREAWGWGEEHRAQPRIVSITQSTELGTVYTAAEIAAISAYAHESGMSVHMDGSRIANAAASLDAPLRAFTTDAGVDVLTFGGTKNGLMFGEVVVVLNPDAVRGIPFLRKMDLQLPSKMRFVSAQFLALLEGDLWLRGARHANAMARRLLAGVSDVPGVEIARPVQANSIFAILPKGAAARLRERYAFHVWDQHTGEVRWMTAFDTTEADVDAFAAAVRDEVSG